MGAFNSDDTIEGELYIQKLSAYIRRNEENLANGLLLFSKTKHKSKLKPSRLSISIHHLYYLLEKIDSSTLGVDIGPLNIRLDTPNHEPTFISFMANNARSLRHFDSDAKSITSISSMKSIVSNASMYWRTYSSGATKDPKLIGKDVRYLYSSFTKLPCLIVTPTTKVSSVAGYEEYPCDTAVPMKMFKNLQVLELVDYDPNEIYGWHFLSDQLRILIIKGSKISDITEVLFNLVVEDENGRSAFNHSKPASRTRTNTSYDHDEAQEHLHPNNSAFKYAVNRLRSHTSTATSSTYASHAIGAGSSTNVLPAPHQTETLPESKWCFLRQLSVIDTSITSIAPFAFKPLANLVKLNLSNNLLETVPEGLSQLENVKYINLADNYITDLRNLPGNLKHLSTLSLNNNKLKLLDGLEKLCNLDKIDLRKNKLESLESLKPVLYLYIKINDKFNNVYLNHNKLPKTFRIDFFNLINGIKFRNSFKLDDSRPGYFESAMLLDNEGAIRNLHNFFKNNSTSRNSLDIVNSLLNLNLSEQIKPFAPLATNQNVSNRDVSKLHKSTTLQSISDSKSPTSAVSQVQVIARMST